MYLLHLTLILYQPPAILSVHFHQKNPVSPEQEMKVPVNILLFDNQQL